MYNKTLETKSSGFLFEYKAIFEIIENLMSELILI